MLNAVTFKFRLVKKLYAIILFVFAYTIINAQYTNLLDFNYTNGKYPHGSLIYDGTFLYGMTSQGGIMINGNYPSGLIFKIKPDGTGYVTLHRFNDTTGAYPFGSLISDGNFLYGMTSNGGANNSGVIFKIKPDGSGFDTLLNFKGANGGVPQGTLIYDGTFLYGTTPYGGANNSGIIFKIKPDGTGYSKLLDFVNDTIHGITPYGSLISDGTFLYGMTTYGGIKGLGTIFKIKRDGTGYSKLLDFVNDTIHGTKPEGSLISDGIFLYGTTYLGGTNNAGTIFKIKPDGSGYSKLLDFTSANGSLPSTLLYDGAFLYGVTYQGGTSDMGTIFLIRTDGSGYSKLLDFLGFTNGQGPWGSLITDGTFLYGMTIAGGFGDMGTIFKYQYNPLDITENDAEKDITIYPNPSNGKFKMQSTDYKFQLSNLEIYNVLGEKVYSTTNLKQQTTNEIDLSSRPNGIYFLRLNNNAISRSERIIIVK